MKKNKHSERIKAIEAYVRAANYISAAQIYLKDNFLIEKPLAAEHIKPRLLGHWGTAPGINFAYAHLNEYLRRRGGQMLFVLGPGHGFAALQANLFIEETLGAYYPEATPDEKGLSYVVKNFSWPYGFPSHSSPATPGVILEGGELGYALATSYGAALDNPQITVACMIGDGESETGPTATAWHLNKFINPAENGFVLPILHLNGYKISGPTIYGRMKNPELKNLFRGLGYEPYFVEGKNIHDKMISALDGSREKFSAIRKKAAKINPVPFHDVKCRAKRTDFHDQTTTPRCFSERCGIKSEGLYEKYPMIILKTPKGWTGIKEVHGEKMEGNCLSHQVVAPDVKTDADERLLLEKWLKSYKFGELFDKKKGFSPAVKTVLPDIESRMGKNRQCFGGKSVCIDLFTPKTAPFLNEKISRGVSVASNMRAAGEYLREVFKENAMNNNFRLFSPDETYSNKLDSVFEITKRAFMREIKPWDKDLSRNGRVIEMLSEHSLQGLFQGYILTGRHGIFASYEAFLQVVASMADQYAKFIKVARKISWRGTVSSMNYILTSPGWRQEHNGFSHQNPGFIDTMLQKHGSFIHVFFPVDRNTTILTLERCLASRNDINLIVAGKSIEPEWLTPDEASQSLERGLLTWEFASDPNPDIVLSSVGDYLTLETLAGLDIIKKSAPEIKIRFVSIHELSALGIGNAQCRLPSNNFTDYFTADKPVIFNFHGYPGTLEQSLFKHHDDKRPFKVNGYLEVGSTTTPLDMHVRNKTSRYHIAKQAYELMEKSGALSKNKAGALIAGIDKKLKEHYAYITEYGVDMPEVESWQWKGKR